MLTGLRKISKNVKISRKVSCGATERRSEERHGEAEVLLPLAHHGARGLARDRVGLAEHGLAELVELCCGYTYAALYAARVPH